MLSWEMKKGSEEKGIRNFRKCFRYFHSSQSSCDHDTPRGELFNFLALSLDLTEIILTFFSVIYPLLSTQQVSRNILILITYCPCCYAVLCCGELVILQGGCDLPLSKVNVNQKSRSLRLNIVRFILI